MQTELEHPLSPAEARTRLVSYGEPPAYTIREFCIGHGISPAHFHALRAKGLGPRIMKIGSRTLISREAAADWRREAEQRTAQEA